MGNCFENISNNENLNDKNDKLSPLYPNAEDLSVIKNLHDNDEFFFYLPELHDIDLQINNLDSSFIETQINIREKLLMKLGELQNKIQKWDSKFQNLENEHHPSSLEYLGPRSKISLKSSSNFLLILEIQQGLLVHPDFFKKIYVTKTYAVIELYKEESLNKKNDILKRWQTEDNYEDIYSPKWKKVYYYNFQDKTDFNIANINIKYCYDLCNNSLTQQQIGEVQTFKTTSFQDQEIYHKEVIFKDPIAKGILAKMIVRFQVIHDIDALKKKKLSELENRKDKVEISERQNFSLDSENISCLKSKTRSQICKNSDYKNRLSNKLSIYFDDNKFFFNNS